MNNALACFFLVQHPSDVFCFQAYGRVLVVDLVHSFVRLFIHSFSSNLDRNIFAYIHYLSPYPASVCDLILVCDTKPEHEHLGDLHPDRVVGPSIMVAN